ncbi:hypothetical protein Hanom_Chr09g00797481 [Helianthus anomalus]
MQNKILDAEKEKLDLFHSKVASLGPSSNLDLRLEMWNNKLNDLSSISFDSSSSDDNNDDRHPTDADAAIRQSQPVRTYKRRRVAGSSSSSHQVSSTVTSSVEVSLVAPITFVSSGLSILGRSVSLPVVTALFPFVSTKESISVTTSVVASTPISSSAIPTASLFGSLPISPSSSNLFATSESTSLPPLTSIFLGMPPGATQSFVQPSSPIVQHSFGPRMIRPIFTKIGTTSCRGGRPKVAFGPRPRTQQKQSDPSVFAPRPSTPRPSCSRPFTNFCFETSRRSEQC